MLSITDLSGKRRVAATVTASTYNWNISQIKTGSYILKVQNGDKVVTRLFMKE